MKRLLVIAIGLLVSIAANAGAFEVTEEGGIKRVMDKALYGTVKNVVTKNEDYVAVVTSVAASVNNEVSNIELQIVSEKPLWNGMDKRNPGLTVALNMANNVQFSFRNVDLSYQTFDKRFQFEGNTYYETIIIVVLANDFKEDNINMPAGKQARNKFLIDYLQKNNIQSFGIYGRSSATGSATMGYILTPVPLRTADMFKAIFSVPSKPMPPRPAIPAR